MNSSLIRSPSCGWCGRTERRGDNFSAISAESFIQLWMMKLKLLRKHPVTERLRTQEMTRFVSGRAKGGWMSWPSTIIFPLLRSVRLLGPSRVWFIALVCVVSTRKRWRKEFGKCQRDNRRWFTNLLTRIAYMWRVPASGRAADRTWRGKASKQKQLETRSRKRVWLSLTQLTPLRYQLDFFKSDSAAQLFVYVKNETFASLLGLLAHFAFPS